MSQDIILNTDVIDDLNGRYLLFYIDEKLYGVHLSLVLEILQVQAITKIPHVSPHIKGIINLRGRVVPVVDVRIKFGLPEVSSTDKTCIIVLEIDGMQIGLIVDSVSEVSTINDATLCSPPSQSLFASKFLSSVTQIDNKVILNIDFEKFFQDDIGLIH